MKNNWRSRKKFFELLLGKNGEGLTANTVLTYYKDKIINK